jgi:hypothetical protein
MRRRIRILELALCALGLMFSATVFAQEQNEARGLRTIRNAPTSNTQPSQPTASSQFGATTSRSPDSNRDSNRDDGSSAHHRHGGSRNGWSGRGWGGGGYGWGWPVYGGYYPYGYWQPYYPGPVIIPPLVIPAETMYGPQAMQRFMGIDQSPVVNQRVYVVAKASTDDATAPKSKVRVTNAAAKAQAGKFMAFGDTHFEKQNYNQALERYKLAAQSAPDMAETYLRQGFALVAMGNYESAAKAMHRALAVQADWSRSHFRLDQLYGQNAMAKAAHLEALARALEESPQSADLLLLLGLQLYFDGQADRAAPLFQRCDQLGGNEDRAIRNFLPQPAPEAVLGREL